MESVKILFAEKTEVEIKDRKYVIGNLGVDQIIKLSRLVIRIAKELPKDFLPKTTNVEDVVTIIQNVSVEAATELIAILLREEDLEFIKNELLADVEATSELLKVICTKTNFKKVSQNFLIAGQAITPKAPKDQEKK